MTSRWVVSAAVEFWRSAGPPPQYPRDLLRILPLTLPVATTVVPALGLRRLESWLGRRGIAYLLPWSDRRLHGCLVAHNGFGLIFVDGSDHLEEQRFSVAHEAAHFLLDYLMPRNAAIDKLGSGIIDVLDGVRAPTREERIDAVLANCPIGIHVHLLERDHDQQRTASIESAEFRADSLARELLAPLDDVLLRVPSGDVADLQHCLEYFFGLPTGQARAYARFLASERRPLPSFVEWLRP